MFISDNDEPLITHAEIIIILWALHGNARKCLALPYKVAIPWTLHTSTMLAPVIYNWSNPRLNLIRPSSVDLIIEFLDLRLSAPILIKAEDVQLTVTLLKYAQQASYCI